MSAATCAACGEIALAGARFCEACGAELVAPTAPLTACANCQQTDFDTDGYCTSCGTKRADPHDHLEEDLSVVAAVTDRGQHHHRNEDAFAVSVAPQTLIAVVCDGVSSTADSHLAARNAAAAARDALAGAHSTSAPDDAMRTAIAAAATAAAGVAVREGQVPSCTIVATRAVLATSGTVSITVGWLGDSRAYLLARDGRIALLTEDDSLAANYPNEPVEQVYARPESHTITRWLGADAADTEPRIASLTAERGDRLLLCSDGLWNYTLTIDALSAQIERSGPHQTPLALAQSLVSFAHAAGGADNITVAIAQLGENE